MDPSFLLPFFPLGFFLSLESFHFIRFSFSLLFSCRLVSRIYATTRLHRTWDLTGNKFRSVSLKPTRERESSRTHRWMDNWIAPVSFQVTGERNHGRGQGIGVIVAAYARKGIIDERRIGRRGGRNLGKEIECPLFYQFESNYDFSFFFFLVCNSFFLLYFFTIYLYI